MNINGKTYKVAKVAPNTTHVFFHTGNSKVPNNDTGYTYEEGYIYDDNGRTNKKVIFVSSSNAKKRLHTSKKKN